MQVPACPSNSREDREERYVVVPGEFPFWGGGLLGWLHSPQDSREVHRRRAIQQQQQRMVIILAAVTSKQSTVWKFCRDLLGVVLSSFSLLVKRRFAKGHRHYGRKE